MPRCFRSTSGRTRALAVLLGGLALACLAARPIAAHSSGLAAIYATQTSTGWTLEARLPGEDLLVVVRGGSSSTGDFRRDLERVKEDVLAYVGSRLELFESGARLAPVSIALGEHDCTRARVTIGVTTAGAGAVTIASRLFTELDRAYRIVLVQTDRGGRRSQSVVWPGCAPLEMTSGASSSAAGPLESLSRFVHLGIEHILSGYDHILFLVALLLLPTTLRRLVATVTCFTLAHSITLACAALDWWALPPWLVEPAIALSICYVALENFFVEEGRHRWLLTFGFGLIHGFGFAESLRSIGLPADAVATSLLGFNLGVELGQVAIVLVLFPLLSRIGRREWYRDRALPAGSLVILYFGLVWLLERI